VPADSAVEARLRELNVATQVTQSDAAIPPGAVFLVEAGVKAGAADRAAWRRALENGATIVVVNADPTDAAWLTALAGVPVRVTVPRYRMWEGRGYRDGFTDLTAGLSQVDLYWKRYETAESAGAQAEKPDNLIEQLQHASVTAEGARELVFPGALVELPVGRGRLVIDQRRRWTAHDALQDMAARNVSALALGLGVEVGPFIAPRSLPKGTRYRPIDLTPFANRSLADDIPEDAMLAAYRRWVDAGARTPHPYNRIGEILERRKDYKGALAAYTASLEIEWNQPPVIVAKERVARRVKP
jgi:hypothetical protein